MILGEEEGFFPGASTAALAVDDVHRAIMEHVNDALTLRHRSPHRLQENGEWRESYRATPPPVYATEEQTGIAPGP